MGEIQRFVEAAEAVADGRVFDWAQAESSAATDADRRLLEAYRHLATLGEVFASASTTGMGTPGERQILPPGSTWGDLHIRAHVGWGRYGDVYRATDPTLDRDVALKLIGDGSQGGAGAAVIDEGRLMARVRHPNVVTIHGARRIGEVTGLWMEFVEGQTLEAELSQHGRFDAEELTKIAGQLAGALAAVHEAGLVHRDVKASNVIRHTDGRVALGDFGTGREFEDPAGTSRGFAGTPVYLAPEVLAGRPATPQSDVYSLGVLLFHLATGDYPYFGRTLHALCESHTAGRQSSLRALRPDLPVALATIIETALQPDPRDRHQSATGLVDSLEEMQRAPVGRRHRAMAIGGVLSAAALIGAMWFSLNGAAAGASGPPALVLVASVEAPEGAPADIGALEAALAAEIDAAPLANVVPPSRVDEVLALMRRPAGTRLDREVAREVAVRDGDIRILVAGAIAGDGRSVSVQLIDPTTNAVAASFEASVASNAAIREAGRRAAAAIGRIRSSLKPVGPPLPRVTTRSLAALRYYADALGNVSFDAFPAIAEKQLREAIKEDPDFVMAYVNLARAIYEQQRDRRRRAEEIKEYLDRAVALSGQVRTVERQMAMGESELLRAMLGPNPQRPDAAFARAEEAARAVLSEEPDNVWAIRCLGLVLGDRQPEFLAVMQRWLEYRPDSLFGLARAAEAAVRSGELSLAQEFLARARPLLDMPGDGIEVAGSRFRVQYLLLHDAWLRGDIEQVADLADAMAAGLRIADGGAVSGRAERMLIVYHAMGQFDRAEGQLSLLQENLRNIRAQGLHLSRPDPDGLRALAAERGHPSVAEHVVFGQAALARAELERWKEENPKAATGVFGHLYEGLVAGAEGRPLRAIESLERRLSLDGNGGPFPDWIATLLADAYVAVDRRDEAIRLLKRFSDRPRELTTEMLRAHDWLDVQNRLAELYRDAGRVADAEMIEARLANMLKYSDPDHRIRRRLVSLGAMPETPPAR